MPRKIVTIRNELGLHARPARLLVQTAGGFKSEIFFHKDRDRVNAKSILGVLTLAAARGSRITIEAEGEDAWQALDALAAHFDNKFGEA
jgi:phosphocarrier protein